MSDGQKIRLRIVSRLTQPDGDVLETKNARTGLMRQVNGAIMLEYDDVQDDEKAHITLELKPGRMPGENRARMLRRGMTSAQLTFLPGQRMGSSYVTIYGEIPVAVDTRRVSILTQENGGCLTLDYDVYMGGDKTSSAVMEVTWRV